MSAIKQALISVSNKQGIVELASYLDAMGVAILSTGGTAQLLLENHIKVTEVSEYTGFPEMMDGRVKTLNPKIHGGILGRRGVDDEVMKAHCIAAIDLVIVNLYPFQKTVANPNSSFSQAIENIDIGGPAMLRAAAKNHADVAVVVDPDDYSVVLDELAQNQGDISRGTRFYLAQKAFSHTASYDGAIANYLACITPAGDKIKFPKMYHLQFEKKQDLRYGENPHQEAAFYHERVNTLIGVASAQQLQGKMLSFNNITDVDAALECVKQFERPACVIVKHANPCGVAMCDDLLAAYDGAYRTDPTSAFGGIIAFNGKLDKTTAQEVIKRQFVEVLIAPEVADDALAVLASKPNVRVLVTGYWESHTSASYWDYKRVAGGLLVQDCDQASVHRSDLRVVSTREPTEQEFSDLLFAWKVAKMVKSNAIVYASQQQTIGVGAGQMSRIYSAKIANVKAADEALEVRGSVMASDAFFPFRDGIDAAAEAGVKAVIQPGGSMRDQEVIEAANEHNMAMVFTGIRHFRH